MSDDRRDGEAPVELSELGYRASRRSSKTGKHRRREARHKRAKASVQERAQSAAGAAGRGLKSAGAVLLAVVAGVALLALVAAGVNYGARLLAARSDGNDDPAAVGERARENLLIIGSAEGGGADFLAVRIDEDGNQVFGIAIPDGAFMEVPGQGFERIGDSYRAGPRVSMAAIANYLSVPFERYLVVTRDVYEQALAEQSLKGIVAQASESSLGVQEREDLGKLLDGIGTDRVALVPLPVKPISLGDETYYEPQRDQVADLLLSWWGVRLGADDGVLRLIIYNGAGIPGIAGEAAQALIDAGMRVVDTRNADRFDYATTLIVVQRGDVARAGEVRDVLGVGETVDQPTQQNVADMIVIIGKDWTPPKE
jgi:hypothetical protein